MIHRYLQILNELQLKLSISDVIKPLYIYVYRIGPINGHMTLTIATFPSTTPKIHRAR